MVSVGIRSGGQPADRSTATCANTARVSDHKHRAPQAAGRGPNSPVKGEEIVCGSKTEEGTEERCDQQLIRQSQGVAPQDRTWCRQKSESSVEARVVGSGQSRLRLRSTLVPRSRSCLGLGFVRSRSRLRSGFDLIPRAGERWSRTRAKVSHADGEVSHARDRKKMSDDDITLTRWMPEIASAPVSGRLSCCRSAGPGSRGANTGTGLAKSGLVSGRRSWAGLTGSGRSLSPWSKFGHAWPGK